MLRDEASYAALRKAGDETMYPATGPIDFAPDDSVASRLPPIVISVTFTADIVYRLFRQLS
jgi:hypothetical protein